MVRSGKAATAELQRVSVAARGRRSVNEEGEAADVAVLPEARSELRAPSGRGKNEKKNLGARQNCCKPTRREALVQSRPGIKGAAAPRRLQPLRRRGARNEACSAARRTHTRRQLPLLPCRHSRSSPEANMHTASTQLCARIFYCRRDSLVGVHAVSSVSV